MKWALVTGATSGIGKATAKKLASEGFNLILAGRRKAELEKIQIEVQSNNIEVVIANFDVTKKSEVLQFVDQNRTHIEQLDILVNNAGLALGSDKLQDANLEDWDVMIDTNIKGLLYLTRAVLPAMIKRKSGHIVNLGSVAGKYVYPGGAVYCASKFAVRALTEGLRMDTLGTGIRVTNIEPGMVETDFSKVRFKGDIEKANKVYAGLTPLSPADIAESIWWSLSRPAHVNIQELVIYPTEQASVRDIHRT